MRPYATTHRNDETFWKSKEIQNWCETNFADFMWLYEHYRARTLRNMAHPSLKGKLKETASSKSKLARTITLKTTRDEWVKGAFNVDTSEYLARTVLAKQNLRQSTLTDRIVHEGAPRSPRAH